MIFPPLKMASTEISTPLIHKKKGIFKKWKDYRKAKKVIRKRTRQNLKDEDRAIRRSIGWSYIFGLSHLLFIYFGVVFGFGWIIVAGLFALAGDTAAFTAIDLISSTGADKGYYVLAIIALLINLIPGLLALGSFIALFFL
jgi:hypothetical protein